MVLEWAPGGDVGVCVWESSFQNFGDGVGKLPL